MAERFRSYWILVVVHVLLLGARLHHLPGVQGAHDETVCGLQDIDIHQVHRVTQGAYIVTISNKCDQSNKAGCEPRNLRVSCRGYKSSKDVDRSAFYKIHGTNECVVHNNLPLTDQVIFAYFQTDQVTFTPISVDFPC